jgi:hypothetical protein
METERYAHQELDGSCRLGEPEVATRAEEWGLVKDRSVGSELIPGGVRVWLPPESGDMVRDLVRREAQCCGFLDIEVAMPDGRVRLDITSAAPAAAELIDFLAS